MLFSDDKGGGWLREEKSGMTLELKADVLSTPGKDYYGMYSLESGLKNITLLELLKVGSIRGNVLDRLENVVPNAEIKFSCENSIGEHPPERTDRFGSFEYEHAPIGNCKIYAAYKKGVGTAMASVLHGQSAEAVIRLDKTLIDYEEEASPLGLILAGSVAFGVFFLAALFILKLKKPVAKKTQEQREEKIEEPRLSARTKDLIETLNHKEKNVVEYLMAAKKKVSQNALSRQVGIPKTSLCRVIESLEQKKIIHVEQIGKFKHIYLTEWFLGGK